MAMASTEHESAARRLDLEQVEHQRLRERYEGAIGTTAESGFYRRLRAAGDQVAARKAWLRWIDQDSYRGLNAGPFELLAEQSGLGSAPRPDRRASLSGRKRKDIQAPDAERDVRRLRRLSRAVEAFQKRAEESERRWLVSLRDPKARPKPTRAHRESST